MITLQEFRTQRDDLIRKLYLEGKSYREIADQVGYTGSSAINKALLRRLGLEPRGHRKPYKWTSDKVKTIRRMRCEGHTMDQIAERFGCSRQNIHSVLKRNRPKPTELTASPSDLSLPLDRL